MQNPSLLTAPFRLLTRSNVADFAIYTGMLSYVLLFIFRDYEIYILWTDVVLEVIKVPYFFKIKEKAIVNESLFYMGANLLAISIGTEAFDSHIKECVTGIMLLR
jgi:hypothetical protein